MQRSIHKLKSFLPQLSSSDPSTQSIVPSHNAPTATHSPEPHSNSSAWHGEGVVMLGCHGDVPMIGRLAVYGTQSGVKDVSSMAISP